MASSIDLSFFMVHVFIKPMLIIAAVLLFLSRPSFRSAAQAHWLLFLTLMAACVALAVSPWLPEWSLAVLPKTAAPLTEVPWLSLSQPPYLLYWLLAPLMLGTVWRLCYVLMGLGEALWLKDGAVPIGRDPSLAALDREKAVIDRCFGFAPSRVHVFVTGKISSPMMIGWLRPCVLLPEASVSWPTDRLQRVLAHEYAHVERFDWLLKMMVALVTGVFWFVPLVWVVARKTAWFAEVACDDRVVTLFTCRAEYAEDLLAISADIKHSAFALAYSDGSLLFERIKLILDPCLNKQPALPRDRMAAGILVCLLVLPVAMMRLVPMTGHYPDPLSLYPQPVAVPMVIVPENSPVADNQRRVAWLNRQLQLDVNRLQGKIAGQESGEKSARIPPATTPPVMPEARIDEHVVVNSRQLGRALLSTVHQEPDVTAINTPRVAMRGYLPNIVVIPDYPKRALKRGVSGQVTVEFDVDTQGRVVAPRVLSAQPADIFNRAVLQALNEFRFLPLVLNGEAVITKNVTETFVFSIDG